MDQSKQRNIAGTLFLVFIGLALACCGASFTWLMWRSYDRASKMEKWDKVEAVVLLSEVEEKQLAPAVPMEYRLKILYGYTVDGKAQESELLTLRGAKWSKDMAKAELLLKKYPESSVVNCYVDPSNPEMAVLKLDTKAPGYSIWFPGLFVLGGVGVVAGAVTQALKRSA